LAAVVRLRRKAFVTQFRLVAPSSLLPTIAPGNAISDAVLEAFDGLIAEYFSGTWFSEGCCLLSKLNFP
jgi:hypothetical protein